ncbi:hypothetical protein [Virgibacillus senegalensis]|uniref:hypothetical protein n=1 Tax=Virgibacillus senegalensis TaxID=1499679 RepID=UPI000A4BF4D9|nr:hypothetical protein [Virgibacillus senegalensis]
MKKVIIMMFFALILLAACSSEGESEEKSEKTSATIEETEEENSEGVNVDKGLLNVEITLPASMVEGESIEDLKIEAEEDGIKEVTKNDDGSLTYKMSKSTHKDMMNEMEESMKESIEETKNSEDFVSIKNITHNNDFTSFTMIVNRSDYENSMDGFATMSLGMAGMMYQLFDGADPDEYSVTIAVEDEETGEKFDEVVYPDAIEDMETE